MELRSASSPTTYECCAITNAWNSSARSRAAARSSISTRRPPGPNLDENQWRTLPSGLRRELTGETIQGLVNDLAQAADAGTLEDPEVVLTRTPLELDERGWKKLNKLMAKTLDQALAIAAESSARRNEGSSDGVFPTEVGILHFRRASGD